MSLLRQLVSRRPSISPAMQAFYTDFCKDKEPTTADVRIALQTELSTLQRVFVVVDALDECNQNIRQFLLDFLHECGANVLAMITSRHLAGIEKDIRPAYKQEVIAQAADLETYICNRISSDVGLQRLAKRKPGLDDEIVAKVIHKAGGM